MKKSLFALAFIACFAFGTSELETLEKECNDGNMESCTQTGVLYLYSGNLDKGVKILKETCDKGDTYSCWFLGSQYIGNGLLEKDIEKVSKDVKNITTTSNKISKRFSEISNVNLIEGNDKERKNDDN